jgi:hypothetical protein
VKSANHTTTLTWNNNGGQTGLWEGTAPGYAEVYELDVTNGTDKVSGVIVDGPDIHVITAPKPGASLDATMAFTTTWDRGAAATEARLAVGDQDGIVIPDTGTYSVAPGSLHTDSGQSRTNTLRLTRTNNIEPQGAIAGSTFSVSVENELDIVALPCPTC